MIVSTDRHDNGNCQLLNVKVKNNISLAVVYKKRCASIVSVMNDLGAGECEGGFRRFRAAV